MIPTLIFAAIVCGACIYMALRSAESASEANLDLSLGDVVPSPKIG
jgi:hypothetical protein